MFWNYSKVDVSLMLEKYRDRRDRSLRKYVIMIGTNCLVDIYQIVMSFMVKLSNLVRLKALEGKVGEYLRVTTKTAVDDSTDQNILDG